MAIARPPLNIYYEVVDLGEVADYFVAGFSKRGGEIERHEFYVDPAKGKMIFRLYIRSTNGDTKSKVNDP